MRVALVTDCLDIGGGIEALLQIVSGIKDVTFGVFALGGNAAYRLRQLDNVSVFVDGYGPKNILGFKPDLIHFHHLKALHKYYKNPFLSYQAPVIFTAHGLHIHKFEFAEGIQSRIKYLLRYYLENYAFNKVDLVITVSLEDKLWLEENYKLQNCVHSPLGIDFSKIDKVDTCKSELRSELSLPANETLFLTVARFVYQKGYSVLVDAISIVMKRVANRNFKFLFVGDGESFEEIKEYSRKLGVYDSILFMGGRSDVYKIMKSSDYLILPSRWEGSPITLIEAGYCRLPLITSDTYGNRETVKHKSTGLLFENEDANALAGYICDIIDKKIDLDKMGESIHASVKAKHGLDSMTNELKQIYNSFFNAD